MVTKPKKRVVERTVRSNGNLYQRLEEARKQRAKVLAMPKPANDAGPAAKPKPKPVATPEPPIAERPPALVVQDAVVAQDPESKKKRFGFWPFAIASAILGLLALVYSMPVQSPPSVQENAVTLPMPSGAASASAAVSPSSEQPIQVLPPKTLAGDTSYSPPLVSGPVGRPVLDESAEASAMVLTASPSPTPKIASFQSAPSASVSELLEPLPDTSYSLAPENVLASLSIALHVPRFTSRRTLNNLVASAQTAGLDVGDPKFVNFPIRATQVRYFHGTDRQAATLLAKAVGGISRDFTDFEPQPPQGFVEVWVSGRPRTAAAAEQRPGLFDNLGRDLRQLGSDVRGAFQSISR